MKPDITPTYMQNIRPLEIADTVNLGLQLLKYPASIPLKSRPELENTPLTPQLKKVPRLSRQYLAGFNKNHTPPRRVNQNIRFICSS